MAEKQQNQPIQPDKKPPVDKKDIVVVKVWSWPKRAAKRLSIWIKHHKVGLMFGVIIAAVIIGLLVLGYMILNKQQESNKQQVKQEQQLIKATNSAVNLATNDTTDVEVNNSNYDQAIENVQSSLAGATTKAEKAQVYNSLAQVALAADKPQDAITYATQANKEVESANSWGIIGSAEAALGNFKSAESAFGKAAALSPKTAPNARSSYNDFLAQQKQMKEKQQ